MRRIQELVRNRPGSRPDTAASGIPNNPTISSGSRASRPREHPARHRDSRPGHRDRRRSRPHSHNSGHTSGSCTGSSSPWDRQDRGTSKHLHLSRRPGTPRDRLDRRKSSCRSRTSARTSARCRDSRSPPTAAVADTRRSPPGPLQPRNAARSLSSRYTRPQGAAGTRARWSAMRAVGDAGATWEYSMLARTERLIAWTPVLLY